MAVLKQSSVGFIPQGGTIHIVPLRGMPAARAHLLANPNRFPTVGFFRMTNPRIIPKANQPWRAGRCFAARRCST